MSPDILVNLAYIIYAVALASKEAIWLRTFLFLSSLIFLTLAIRIEDKLLLAWNILFCLISGFRMLELLLEDRSLKIDSEKAKIWQKMFPTLSKKGFLTFWDMGSDEVFDNGAFIEQGKPTHELMLMIEGEVEITQGQSLVAKRIAGDFLGEMSFFTGDFASATVTAPVFAKVRAWPHEKLRALKAIEPLVFEALQEILTLALVSKADEQGGVLRL